MPQRLQGLIPATYTPLSPDGTVDLDAVKPLTEWLLAAGADGFYVCGSTGEGVSLSSSERKRVAAEFVASATGRVPVIVHVGHDSLVEAADLATHAASIGADAISAMPPCYFPIRDADTVVECCQVITAAAPHLPFYYYHIPVMTGVGIDLTEVLRKAGDRIPSFAGAKYTAHTLHEYQECLALDGGRFEMLSGYDELLLPALALGARAAVGSTFNIATPLYRRVIDAFDAGDLEAARREQLRAIAMIRVLMRFPFHPAVKAVLGMLGVSCGECRPPLPRLSTSQHDQLRAALDAIGFFEWVGTRPAPAAA
ncbi:MAG: dihydrodipicolinate synthase family protein [Planctomycetia bacterium]|nr:dihydrodipicolinate synthase family protein [Planctomycetia bacterium]